MKIIVDFLETHCDDFRNCKNYRTRVLFVYEGKPVVTASDHGLAPQSPKYFALHK